MRHLFSFVLVATIATSCGVSKKSVKIYPLPQVDVAKTSESIGDEQKNKPSKKERKSEINKNSDIVSRLISESNTYLGTPYKFGGTDKSGIDCSGLMVVSFMAVDVQLPRTSHDQSERGKPVSKSKLKEGDLIFFKTTSKARVSHVGLVVGASNSDVSFIHSSSSRGVMLSKLSNPYWSKRYVKAKRYIY